LKSKFSPTVIKLGREIGLIPKERLTLGITLSYQYQSFLELKHGKELLKIIPPVLDRFITANDAQVILFPHVTGPTKVLDDRNISFEIHAACMEKERVKIITQEISPHEIKALISRCDLFCGARMHSNIAAITTGVPTIALSYSVKSRGIMSRLGMENWVIEMDSLNTDVLNKKLDALYENQNHVRVLLKTSVHEIIAKAMSNIKFITPLLSHTHIHS
jgi:colanic acid/amylovoran biosynthesis protein